MRTIRPTVMLTAALLVFAAPGCDHTPTAVHDDAAGSALFSSNAQSRVDLCHRNSSGDYVKITVADAAYSTHMAHGDLPVGEYGCATDFSFLEVILENYDWNVDAVTVTQHAFGGAPARELGECTEIVYCFYTVPTGATVTLSSIGSYTYIWDDDTIGATRVMDTHRSVRARDF